MQYAISKENVPQDAEDLQRAKWFHLWSKKLWPYRTLKEGDTLFFFDKKSRRFIWKAEVVDVEHEPYPDKKVLRQKHEMSDAYFKGRAESGFFLRYEVRAIEKINSLRPKGFSFERNGWAKVENGII